MDNIRLLIVDDVEDNRLVLRAICRKLEGFEIQEAQDGIEAVEKADSWSPHIILMDIMMPRLDGFEASKIIKERYPHIIIMAVTAVIDPKMEENMASIGVAAYIRKPIDKDLIRFKLQNFSTLLRSKEGKHKKLSAKEALNPFCSDIRHFKTIFDISDTDAMMDFGMWILGRCEERVAALCTKVDTVIELFYEIMRYEIRQGGSLAIIIEESFEEIYITMKYDETINLKPKTMVLLRELGNACIVRDTIVCIRLQMQQEQKSFEVKEALPLLTTAVPVIEIKVEPQSQRVSEPMVLKEIPLPKETRALHSDEKEMLHQSFIYKTTAVKYVSEIGGDVLDEIRDLVSVDEEWRDKLSILEEEPSAQNIWNFVDGVLSVYVGAINNLFEFTALAYALTSLGSCLKEHADAVIADATKRKNVVMFMEHLGSDLVSWRDHIFSLQDAGDIHYLDSSFFSSCMQIEGMISNKEIETDDDNEMEFF
ncbi:MAG: response regulator [Sulfuricurvum sp.]|nr:response regulator [Sulfuricurvum sp.]